MPGEWLSLKEAAEYLGVHTSTVRSWADKGRVPVHRTQGGHRRFRRGELELCVASQKPDASDEIDRVAQSALRNTRLQIAEGRLEAESWYQKLDEESRIQYRQSGRTLLQGLINFLAKDADNADAEAHSLGYEYAYLGRRRNLSYLEATHAFLFFRNLLLDATLTAFENASVRSPEMWAAMLRKINAFTDQILETILETYESYQRSLR
jgi:excisionase family DNA binding protein